MDKINITSAVRVKTSFSVKDSILATIDGVEVSVPADPANRHYAAIMEMVNAGELTIAETDA